MVSKAVVALSLVSNLVAAEKSSCDPQSWTVEGKALKICYSMKLNARVSIECEKKECGAAKLLKGANAYQRGPSKIFTSNPGSDVCRNLKGEITIGRNARGSEIAFCQAKDGTMVDLFSLAQARSK